MRLEGGPVGKMAENGKLEGDSHDGHQQRKMDAAGGVSSQQEFDSPEVQQWFSPLLAVASSMNQFVVEMMAIVQQQNQLAMQMLQQYDVQQLEEEQQQLEVRTLLLLEQQHDFFKVCASNGVEKAQGDGDKDVGRAVEASSCDDTVGEEDCEDKKIEFEQLLDTVCDDEKIAFSSSQTEATRRCVPADETTSGMESFRVKRGKEEEKEECLEFKRWRLTQVVVSEGSRQLAVDISCESVDSKEPLLEAGHIKLADEEFENKLRIFRVQRTTEERKTRTKQRKLFRSHRCRLRPRTRWKVSSSENNAAPEPLSGHDRELPNTTGSITTVLFLSLKSTRWVGT